jgi:hypothetical protein
MYSAIYFPIQRAKRGEMTAIGYLSPEARTRIRPNVDIQKQKAKSKEPIEYYLSDLSHEFAKNWGTTLPICFDFLRYGPEEETRDGRHPMEYFFACARQLGVQAIPVAGPESVRGPGYEYLDAVARVAQRDGLGAVVRMPYRDFSRFDSFPDALDDVLKAIGLKDPDVDLVLDFEALALLPNEARSSISMVAVITDALQAIEGRAFRNVVLCGSSIPEQVNQRYNWKPLKVPRIELEAWLELMTRFGSREIKFGDYGVMYAHGSDINAPRQPPSRVRLSTPVHHLLCRAPAGEYRKLSSEVIRYEDFRANFPAWGVTSIYSCGIGTGGEGGATEWVARDTNLHFEVTAQFLQGQWEQTGQIGALEFAEPDQAPWYQNRLEGLST